MTPMLPAIKEPNTDNRTVRVAGKGSIRKRPARHEPRGA